MDQHLDESEDLAAQDWRFRAASSLAKPLYDSNGSIIHPVGTAVIQSSSMRIEGITYSFGVPSAPAFFLDLSKKAFRDAEKLRAQPDFLVVAPGKTPLITSRVLFDFLEQMMASVVFAYTSIESFANSTVPEGYIYRDVRKDGKCTEEYTKDQIERHFSLEKKLELIIQWSAPEKIVSPKGTTLWQRFQALEELRNRIIHLKSTDTKASKPDDPVPDTIWQELLGMPETFQIIADLLKHYTGTRQPRWLRKFELI